MALDMPVMKGIQIISPVEPILICSQVAQTTCRFQSRT